MHIDGGKPRAMRCMNLANELSKRGHQVVIWSSDFYHQEKRHRFGRITVNDIDRNIKVVVPRYFQWKRGGLDAHRMMTGDDTGGDVLTVAGAW